MNSKQFLVIGGLILVLLGVLGFVGVIGPTADKSIFGSNWWFDNGENWAHLVLGVVGLLAAFTFPAASQKVLVMVLGVVGILVGLYSIFNQSFLGANLENPADTILHLAVGVWALYASMNKGSMATMS
ncbi:MAG: hypothetical protein A3J07_03345 [Candidatus Doudnabacteria bacterium RIFCSPLOWO2_02_FULL_49_13]|uniref:DUF4383 domain-containing protein n=1 Tax=Candidatus Doudnabacteria bacterium RIFCSPHIGHO2_12_FULL_48_16 TaxID=1817838 RepID=A0A1F5PJC3_9BACT|nr:MAG: hypothetical protein A3B77_02150 [Candidatus Doudnabacteria bacterium RIFCSPHIGHO2_02_FULL_49_24]OGE89352.1 MAG: hypothetical protein A2760_03200 [Candidatus Doudnabacteria bacterium RIFCSPHIGHO2_01_FULL_50_67]OGE89957.1 MAG: hypothetical protein A3E29_02490 [Candidatus Doudnabacteria bacterium RIFCSPHIGHO2_12_FULL_48_16]OGE97498.1 MAG: hypothetical protein A2990_02145 [Candidatus Doudnabacteria bacterium RIFCSPLOWO2_01_FULL_49_40]OGF03098.1 MAG: hypothetical protein A3J07_03345 [Candid